MTNKQKWLIQNGFNSDGIIYLVGGGNTYKIKDYLKSLGYIIYRIPWNEINSEVGKLKMQNKIDKFLKFYKAL